MAMLSIIIPAYNEAPTLRQLTEKILQVRFPVDYEIVIVNDSSHDNTRVIAEELEREHPGKVQVIHNEVNRGKGYSIKRGFHCARGSHVIVQDADFEYDPADIPAMFELILQSKADAVLGSRFLRAKHPEGMAYPNKIANRLLTHITNSLFGSRLTDVYSCYKLMSAKVVLSLQLECDGFESEAELIAKLLKTRQKIAEVPVSYRGRTVKQGKKIKASDFFKAIRVFIKYRSVK